jgi:hypothetical protein
MRRWHVVAGAWLIIGLAFLLGTENFVAKSFGECVAQQRNAQSTNNPNKSRFLVGRTVEPQFVCTGQFLDAHAGLIAALGGLVVAFFTATLWRSTDKLWHAGERPLRVARQATRANIATAKAAKKSADAVVAVERARFFIDAKQTNMEKILGLLKDHSGSMEDHVPNGTPFVTVSFKNFGKTPGTIQEICCDLKVSDSPFDPVYSTLNVKAEMIAGGDSTEEITVWFHGILTFKDLFGIQLGREWLWLYGKVYYEDAFKGHQVHRFYWRFGKVDRYGFGFRPYRYKHYNQSS